jgi:hypothetical protein
MTSTTKARECELAVDEMESTASQILCRAVNPPMVKSVMAMSLLQEAQMQKIVSYHDRPQQHDDHDRILDRPNEPDNVQMRKRLGLNLGDPLVLEQLADERRPLFPQHVGSGQ